MKLAWPDSLCLFTQPEVEVSKLDGLTRVVTALEQWEDLLIGDGEKAEAWDLHVALKSLRHARDSYETEPQPEGFG